MPHNLAYSYGSCIRYSDEEYCDGSYCYDYGYSVVYVRL